jgi:putative transposase
VRYVHCNPLAAGMVESLDALATYPWSGHGALVGRRAALPFEAVAEALSLFDDDPARARGELRSWMARTDLADPTQPTAAASAPASSPLSPPSHPPGGVDELFRAACAHYGLAPEELRSGSKQPRIARARAAVAYIAVIALGECHTAVARALGVGRTAVSRALDRGRRAAEEDGLWRGELRNPRGESDHLTI